ncbi:MAG: quinol:cytochrome C oxidoreductase [Planctomycetota bacterium]|nr:MAG: quinol:cytochrome C oxidoreductase [Planctomycetota bacterium]
MSLASHPKRSLGALGATALCAALLAPATGCGSRYSEQPPIQVHRNMYKTVRADAQEASDFFPDRRVMRMPVEGTVPRGSELGDKSVLAPDPDLLQADDHYYRGIAGGEPAASFPPQLRLDAQLLARGRERFDIYCAACHDRTGQGRSQVAQRGLAPPSLLEERIRQAPVGHIFQTISQGRNTMPSYAAQIPVADRWAIVAWVRVLQWSGHLELARLPAAVRSEVQRELEEAAR